MQIIPSEESKVIDVTTPVPVERNTNNFYGWQSWSSVESAAKIVKEGLNVSRTGLEPVTG